MKSRIDLQERIIEDKRKETMELKERNKTLEDALNNEVDKDEKVKLFVSELQAKMKSVERQNNERKKTIEEMREQAKRREWEIEQRKRAELERITAENLRIRQERDSRHKTDTENTEKQARKMVDALIEDISKKDDRLGTAMEHFMKTQEGMNLICGKILEMQNYIAELERQVHERPPSLSLPETESSESASAASAVVTTRHRKIRDRPSCSIS
jgi:peptidoglycan hydrolase CwlO-like protein